MQRYETAWFHIVGFMVSYLGETGVKDEYRSAGAGARVASKSQMLFKRVFITGRIKFVTSVLCACGPLTPFAGRSSWGLIAGRSLTKRLHCLLNKLLSERFLWNLSVQTYIRISLLPTGWIPQLNVTVINIP